MKNKFKTIIIGAGSTGLSAAFYLKGDYLLVEAGERCGGTFNSFLRDRFTLDLGERFVRIEGERKRYFADIFGNDFFCGQNLFSQIQLSGKRFWYPFQYHLYGLKKEKLISCVTDFINNYKTERPVSNYYDWIKQNFGDGITREFMLPYNKKIWRAHPARMSYDWAFSKQVIPGGDIKKVLAGAFFPLDPETEDFPQRYYPKQGGAGAVCEHMRKKINGPLLLNAEVVNIDTRNKKITVKGRGEFGYQNLVSTIPLPELLKIMPGVSERVRDSSGKLTHNSVLCFIFGLNYKAQEKCHWIYFPEQEYKFARAYIQTNFSSDIAPRNTSVVGAIVTFKGTEPPVEELGNEILEQLIGLKLIRSRASLLFKEAVIIKYGFCIPLLDTKKISESIRSYLAEKKIFSIGRYGEWKYSGLEHALEDGKKIAERLS